MQLLNDKLDKVRNAVFGGFEQKTDEIQRGTFARVFKCVFIIQVNRLVSIDII